MKHLELLMCVALLGCPKPDTTDTDTTTTTTTTGDTATETTAVVRGPAFESAAAAIQTELATNLASGVSVAVSVGGERVWVETFGTTDPDGDTSLTPDTILQIGSTTKHMAAAQALVQVQAGRLDVTDTVASRLPGVSLSNAPAWATDSTLDMLLSHQGGTVDFIDWAGDADDAELLDWHEGFFSAQLFPMSPPAAFWNYSNPNFTVAGLMAESVDPDGAYWPDAMTRDLFAPLGMSRTFARKAEVRDAGDFALSVGTGALGGPADRMPMPQVPDPASVRPAGLVWSTPSDMVTWGEFVLHGDDTVLSDALREEITTPHVSTLYFDDLMGYGYGMFTWEQYPLSDGEWYPIRVWEHGGNTLSFTSSLVILPDHDVVFSILSNGAGDDHSATVEAILRAVVDPLPAPTGYDRGFDPVAIADHVGSYSDPNNVGPMEITAGGKFGLQIELPLLPGFGYDVDPDLVPLSTDVWLVFLNGEGFDLTFVRPLGKGPPQYVRNRAFVAERTPPKARLAPASPTSARAPALTPSRLPSTAWRRLQPSAQR
ncbi:MAG: beta-lactamase family protein [Myxococcales bacterium]|nr:beta-lactamase family protein [Myxococcales bacterium]